jgi:hypothetical protein
MSAFQDLKAHLQRHCVQPTGYSHAYEPHLPTFNGTARTTSVHHDNAKDRFKAVEIIQDNSSWFVPLELVTCGQHVSALADVVRHIERSQKVEYDS